MSTQATVQEPSKKLKANATYTEMITAAILDLNDRTGSSTPAIASWIAKHHPKLKVKKTSVGAKIRPLVQSGYLVRAKSSFKLSASTRDQIRKAKVAKANKANRKKEGAAASKKDRGLDQISRVRKRLGLLPLVSNHHIFDELTQVVAEHTVEPVVRDATVGDDRPKAKRQTGRVVKKTKPAGNVDATAVAAAMQSGAVGMSNVSMMRGAGRAKSAYNFYQDSVRANIRKERPRISMPDLRKEMMARWSAMSAEEKEPYEVQGAVAKELFNQMQAEDKSAAAMGAAPTTASTLDGAPAASSVTALEDENPMTSESTGAMEPSFMTRSIDHTDMAIEGSTTADRPLTSSENGAMAPRAAFLQASCDRADTVSREPRLESSSVDDAMQM